MRLPSRRVTVRFVGLALVAIVGLVESDHLVSELEHPELALALHHFLALVAGASTAGLLFELFARQEVTDEFIKSFINRKDVAALFRDEERYGWVGEVIRAQLPSNPQLSDAVFNDVVKPLMTQNRYREQMDYLVKLHSAPPGGWTAGKAALPAAEYHLLEARNQITQHFPEPVTEVNVVVIIHGKVETLHALLTHKSSVYREWLEFDAAHHVAAVQSELMNESVDPTAFGIDVDLAWEGHALTCSRLERNDGYLRYWFKLPYAMSDASFVIRVKAPYPASLRHYLVIFSEPTNTPLVNFVPPPGVSADDVKMLDLIQGARDPKPVARPVTGQLVISFEHARWVLPRSGYVLVWG